MMDVLPFPTRDRPPARPTYAGLDAIRAFAALGVVMLHACVPYLQNPMPGLVWTIRDTPSSLVDIGFWTIELFVMPLFLVLAGLLAWQTLRRRGSERLVKSRARRLLVPFVFGCVLVLPIDLHIWVLGWVAEGHVAPVKLRSFKFDGVIDRDLWGTSHLWFLPYLFLYVVVLALWNRGRERFLPKMGIETKALTVAALLVTAASFTVFLQPGVVWGFQHSFTPVASKWIYCGLFFVTGLLIASRDPHFGWLQMNASRLIAPACLFAIAAVTLGRWHLSGGNNQAANATLAVITVLAAAMITLSIVGMAVKRIHRVSTTVKYLSAASFWIYLIHHPILGLVHVDLKLLFPEAGPILKATASFSIGLAVSLLTYEGLVRKTVLGRWLGFAWSLPSTPSDDCEQSAPILSLPSSASGNRRAA